MSGGGAEGEGERESSSKVSSELGA